MRIVFMGTPDFAAGSAEALKAAGHEILAVFTQPDKPRSRGKKIIASPVKDFALKNDIPVCQPQSLRKGEDAKEALKLLKDINPDVIAVAAYGQILPREILELPKYGCVNVHASLLPKYRGAAPVQRCIQNGEKKTGVCIMKMDEGLDTGDVIMRREVEIPEEMTGSELFDELEKVGAELLVETMKALENGSATFTKQENDETATYARMIDKSELKLDFTKSAKELYDFIRAMADAPCVYTMVDGKRLKVCRSKLTMKKSPLPAGAIADLGEFAVVCGDGFTLRFTEVQPEGGKKMNTDAFLRGKKLTERSILDSE